MQEPQPQLAELLRTCVHPPSLLLRIENVELIDIESQRDETNASLNVDSISASDITRRYAVKYILSDGEIMMQALLHRKLLRDTADVVIGDLLDIRRFTVKKSRRSDGHGHVVYLAIDDCHFLQQVQSTSRTSLEEVKHEIGTRKRKRTISDSGSGLAKGGPVLHARMDEIPNNSPEPLPDEQPAANKISEDVLSRSDNRNMADSMRAVDLQKPLHNEIGDSFKAVLPPNDQYESREVPSGKGKFQRDRSEFLRNTFGARQIMSDDNDDDDFFEALSTNQNTVNQRRRALQKLDGNMSFGSQVSSGAEKPESNNFEPFTPFESPSLPKNKYIVPAIPPRIPPLLQPDVKKSVRDGTFALSQTPTFYLPPPPPITAKPQQQPRRQVQTQPAPQPAAQPALLPSPPFHTLSSLRNPPPSQYLPSKSYTLTTLGIVSWTGTTTIHRPGSLFPPKRHLKIVDPSLSASRPPSRQAQPQVQQSGAEQTTSSFKGQNSFQDAVTVAVYIDAINFKPAPGTIVLFRGLVMQRLVNGDIILNAYGRLKEQRFEEATSEKKENPGEAGGPENDHVSDQDGEQNQFNNHWFVTDQSRIRKLGHGSRLDYYLDWWAEKQRGQQPVQD